MFSETMNRLPRLEIKERLRRKKKVIVQLFFILLGTIILSFTVGKNIIFAEQPGIFSFAAVNFAGYLFFLLLPVEILVPFYIAEGHSGILIVLLAVSTALLAQVIDYSIGNLTSNKIINDLIGEKRYQRAEDTVRKYGYLAIFLFNLFPLSSPIIILVSGMLRFPMRKVFLYSFLGLMIKYTFLVFLFSYF